MPSRAGITAQQLAVWRAADQQRQAQQVADKTWADQQWRAQQLAAQQQDAAAAAQAQPSAELAGDEANMQPLYHASGFEPTVTLSVENPINPIFHGTTNLPDGVRLIVTITRIGGGAVGQDPVEVREGRFTAQRFSVIYPIIR